MPALLLGSVPEWIWRPTSSGASDSLPHLPHLIRSRLRSAPRLRLRIGVRGGRGLLLAARRHPRRGLLGGLLLGVSHHHRRREGQLGVHLGLTSESASPGPSTRSLVATRAPQARLAPAALTGQAAWKFPRRKGITNDSELSFLSSSIVVGFG